MPRSGLLPQPRRRQSVAVSSLGLGPIDGILAFFRAHRYCAGAPGGNAAKPRLARLRGRQPPESDLASLREPQRWSLALAAPDKSSSTSLRRAQLPTRSGIDLRASLVLLGQ